jgi:TIR domain-containing protein
MISISYRRQDSLPIAGRLYDRLQAKFGKKNIFMDFDSIPPGVDFREQIKQTIERSNVVIAVIGPHWLGELHDGSRRIDDPTDFVRLEIEYALKRGIPVIPLLINNTPMPKPEKLPPSIEGFAFRNALPLDSGLDFHQHADRLIHGISNLIDESRPRLAMTGAGDQDVENKPQRSLTGLYAAVGTLLVAGFAGAIWFAFQNWQRDKSPQTARSQEVRTVERPVESSVTAPQATPSLSKSTEATAMLSATPAIETPASSPTVAANEPNLVVASQTKMSPTPALSASETQSPNTPTTPAPSTAPHDTTTHVAMANGNANTPSPSPPRSTKLFAGTWEGQVRAGDKVPWQTTQLVVNESETGVSGPFGAPLMKGWHHTDERTLSITIGSGAGKRQDKITLRADGKTADYSMQMGGLRLYHGTLHKK